MCFPYLQQKINIRTDLFGAESVTVAPIGVSENAGWIFAIPKPQKLTSHVQAEALLPTTPVSQLTCKSVGLQTLTLLPSPLP